MEVLGWGSIILAAMFAVWFSLDNLYKELVQESRLTLQERRIEAEKYLKAASVIPVLAHLTLALLLILDRATYQTISPNIWLDVGNSPFWLYLHLAVPVGLFIVSFVHKSTRRYTSWVYIFSFATLFVWSATQLVAGLTSDTRVGFLGPAFGLILATLPLLLANRWAEQVEGDE